MSDTAVVEFEFELDNSPIDEVPFDSAIYSDVFSAGGHDWRMACTPNDVGGFVSVYLELMTEAKNVMAILEAAIADSDQAAEGPSCFSRRKTVVRVYNNPLEAGEYVLSGFARFTHRDDLHEHAGNNNGRVRIMCAVSVAGDDTNPMANAPPFRVMEKITVPPSEIEDHLDFMLDSPALTDVSFVVGDDDKAPPLHAHRALLSARSPVFEAEFCGHMSPEANTPSSHVTVRNMDSETLKTMLRFMYTDNLPAGLGDDALQSLLAAADRYALARLKLLCARKLLENMSGDTVAAVLDCAETYNCPELKTKCIDFAVAGENFRKVALTDGFMELLRRYPSILAETRNRQ
jgi:speckle-type POZ protein